MDHEKVRVAIATEEEKGLEDVVSNVFARAKTFTILDVDEGKVKNLKIIQNSAVSYKSGAGPIVVKTLADLGVNRVIASEFGPGASTLLEQLNVAKVRVDAGSRVSEIVKNV
jgi:predicted Fe-Mo cluster-binding NifX family protein